MYRMLCKSCGSRADRYYGAYDRFACSTCDVWTESEHCVDKDCDAGFLKPPLSPSLVTQPFDLTVDWY